MVTDVHGREVSFELKRELGIVPVVEVEPACLPLPYGLARTEPVFFDDPVLDDEELYEL
jgi:hypothetical protein